MVNTFVTLNSNSFKLWKWRSLIRRRPFYMIMLQIYLVFTWAAVWKETTRDSNHNNNIQPLKLIPIILLASHGLIFTVYLIGGSYLQSKQEKRFCDWSAFSTIVLQFWSVFADPKHDYPHENLLTAIYLLTSLTSLLIFHHIGIAEYILVLIKFFTFITWIIFLSVIVSFYLFCFCFFFLSYSSSRNLLLIYFFFAYILFLYIITLFVLNFTDLFLLISFDFFYFFS